MKTLFFLQTQRKVRHMHRLILLLLLTFMPWAVRASEVAEGCHIIHCGTVCTDAGTADDPGQICSAMVSPEAACYSQHGVCAANVLGGCSWKHSKVLAACLAAPRTTGEPGQNPEPAPGVDQATRRRIRAVACTGQQQKKLKDCLNALPVVELPHVVPDAPVEPDTSAKPTMDYDSKGDVQP